MTYEEIAQWVINNRYPKSEHQKIDDAEMFTTIIEMLVERERNNADIAVVSDCSNCGSDKIIKEDIYRCKECNSFHDKTGAQL